VSWDEDIFLRREGWMDDDGKMNRKKQGFYIIGITIDDAI